MQPAVGIIMLVVFATGFVVGILLGYGWGREDAQKTALPPKRENGMAILLKKLLPTASLPKYAKEGDSGMDVAAAEATVIPARGYGKVRTGLAAIIPANYELQLRPRSGLCNKGVVAAFGTIDNGYRGEIGVVLFNNTDAPFRIEVGDRIAQLVPMEVRQFRIEEHTGDMPASERGEAGFGSSGMK